MAFIQELVGQADAGLGDLFEELRSYLLAMGYGVQEKHLKYYIAFKRIRNFACVEAHPSKGCLTIYVRVDPESLELEHCFTRDMRGVGHYGTGDLEILLRNRDDLERAKPLVERSYESS